MGQRSVREFTDASTAIVRGALDAGCDFFAGYPITPASSILMMMMEHLPAAGGVAIQGEDEIASIGMCIGATMGGASAMTATSGPGLSLYSENIGLAVMGEVPLVIVDVQRMGPATGGATTVAQGDVQFLRWGTSGGYPVIALAPSSIPEAYALTVRAFAFAERFRCPVFLVTDKELALTSNTVDAADLEPGPGLDRDDPMTDAVSDGTPYRFEPPDVVAPLRSYGGTGTVRFTGSTHDEAAFITRRPATVDALNRHLAAKIEDHRLEIELVSVDPEPGADTLLLSYGITAAAMREATRRARDLGRRVASVTVHSLWPVPEDALARAMVGIDRVVVAELNLGQYRREIERLAGGRIVEGLNRVDGGLITPEQFLEVLG